MSAGPGSIQPINGQNDTALGPNGEPSPKAIRDRDAALAAQAAVVADKKKKQLQDYLDSRAALLASSQGRATGNTIDLLAAVNNAQTGRPSLI